MLYTKVTSQPLDLSRVRTIVYHLPDGKSFEVPATGMEDFIDFSQGKICDTSEIDGVIHFFPRGHA